MDAEYWGRPEAGAALVFTGNVVICADHGGAFDWDVEVGMLAAAALGG